MPLSLTQTNNAVYVLLLEAFKNTKITKEDNVAKTIKELLKDFNYNDIDNFVTLQNSIKTIKKAKKPKKEKGKGRGKQFITS